MYKEFLKQGGRFITSKGELTVENLLRLSPTQTNVNFLDELAVQLDEAYNNSKSKSFVVKKTRKDKFIKIQLDIVLDILGDMIDIIEEQKAIKDNKAELQTLLAIKAKRDEEAKEKMSDTELNKRIAELNK